MPAIRLHRPGEPETILTVETVVSAYLRHCAAENVHGEAAKADRAYTFKLFIEACGSFPVAELKPYHLQDFIAEHPEWKSVSTRRKRAGAIRAAFQWATDQERIGRNPFRTVRYAEAERRPEIPDSALERINEAANKPTERILRFIRLTSCRSSEACEATWADVDLERGIWTVNRHKSRKRTGRAKLVALVPEAVALLNEIRTRAVAALANPGKVGTPPVPANAPIFLNTRGRPFNHISLWKAMTYTKKRAGVTAKGAVHAIRHTAATAMVVAGAPIALVAAQLGHANSRVTERYYVHLEGQMDAIRAAASLGVPKK